MCLHYFYFKMNMYLIFKNTEKGYSCPPLPPPKFPCSCRPNGSRIEKTSGNLQSPFLPLPSMQLFCSQTASFVSLQSPYLPPPPGLFSSPRPGKPLLLISISWDPPYLFFKAQLKFLLQKVFLGPLVELFPLSSGTLKSSFVAQIMTHVLSPSILLGSVSHACNHLSHRLPVIFLKYQSDSVTSLLQTLLQLPIAHRVKAKLNCLASATSSTTWDNAHFPPNPCTSTLFTELCLGSSSAWNVL